jgi:hypothetical protein
MKRNHKDEWLPPKPPPKSVKGPWDASFRNMKIANDILKKWKMDKYGEVTINDTNYKVEDLKVVVDGDNIKINIWFEAPVQKVDINFVVEKDGVDKIVPPLKAQILTEGGI